MVYPETKFHISCDKQTGHVLPKYKWYSTNFHNTKWYSTNFHSTNGIAQTSTVQMVQPKLPQYKWYSTNQLLPFQQKKQGRNEVPCKADSI